MRLKDREFGTGAGVVRAAGSGTVLHDIVGTFFEG